jgi:UbiD family decarboxylase
MPNYSDLRDFIDKVSKAGELRTFSGAKSDLEVGGITEVAWEFAPVPLCLFQDIKGCGSEYRVLTNLYSSRYRESLLYGIDPQLSIRDGMRAWKERIKDVTPLPPRLVTDGAVLSRSSEGDNIDLSRLPFIRWHEHDGGGYLCATSVTIRDPRTKYLNVGSYRFQYRSPTTMVCHIGSGHNGDVLRKLYWEQGKPCPITISLGQDPSLIVAAGTDLRFGTSEYDYAGWLRGEPVNIIDGPATGVPMPADAEIVIEAELLPPGDGMADEGPFGESSGYYGGGVHQAPIVKVLAVHERPDPIVLGLPPVKGRMRTKLGSRAVQIWKELEDLGVPNVMAVNYAWGMTIIAIRQMYPGHPMRAAHGALGGTAGYHGRLVVVVDEDVNIYDPDEVLWAISTRCDPETSIDIARRIWSYRIDPRLSPDKRAKGELTGSAAIIDACRPFHWKDQFPPVTGISSELRDDVLARWSDQIGGVTDR